MRKLCDVLVRGDDPHVLLARLFQDHREVGIGCEIVLAFVDVDEAWQPLRRREGGALLRGLRNEREKEATENLRALLLEQVLGGIDEDHFAAVDLGKEIELRFRIGQHPVERAVFADGEQTGDHLLLRLREDRGVELRVEEVARAALEFCEIRRELLATVGLHKFAERVDGRVRDELHGLQGVTEEGRLPAGHLSAEQALEDELHDFGCGVQQPFTVEEGIGVEPLQPHVEEVERDGVFDIGGVDQDEFAVEQVAFGEERQTREHRDQRVLRIDDHDRRLAVRDALQIVHQHVGDRIGLAVPSAAHDPMMLEARLLRQLKGHPRFEKLDERRAAEVRLDQLIGRQFAVACVHERTLGLLIREDFGDATLIFVRSLFGIR